MRGAAVVEGNQGTTRKKIHAKLFTVLREEALYTVRSFLLIYFASHMGYHKALTVGNQHLTKARYSFPFSFFFS